MKRLKYLKNILNSKVGLRNRLKIYDDLFELNRIGATYDTKYPVFPSEWDENYIDDMQERTKAMLGMKS